MRTIWLTSTAGLTAPHQLQGQQVGDHQRACLTRRGTRSLFTQFEAKRPRPAPLTHHAPSVNPTSLEEHEVRKALKEISPRKGAGPDGVMEKDAKALCKPVVRGPDKDFQHLPGPGYCPSLPKGSTIILVPRRSATTCLNDFRLVALNSEVMKCFNRLVLCHVLLPS